MQGVIGIIINFAGDFAPQSWARCDGQLMQISQNQSLFSILGTTFGGNGQSTFALPDLRGRTGIGVGQGPGLSNQILGSATGAASVTLLASNLPLHNHTGAAQHSLGANSTEGGQTRAVLNYPAGFTNGYATTANASMAAPISYAGTVANAGGSQAINIRTPYLGLNYIICLNGIFPSRN